jgi:opacity protein-like surface antigen
MRKTLLISVLLAFTAASLGAADIRAGFLYSARTVQDDMVKDVYGNGAVSFPSLSARVWKGLFLGLGYEGGYSKDGTLGLHQEPASLEVTGYEFFAGYELRLKNFAPYVTLGYGSYRYRQTVESAYVGDIKVDERKAAVTLGAGLKYFPFGKLLFIEAGIRYVPLKVKPYDAEVDLGGLRYGGGIGLSFGL